MATLQSELRRQRQAAEAAAAAEEAAADADEHLRGAEAARELAEGTTARLRVEAQVVRVELRRDDCTRAAVAEGAA